MNRRTFFVAGSATLAAAGTLGWNWYPAGESPLTITAVKARLAELDVSNVRFAGEW